MHLFSNSDKDSDINNPNNKDYRNNPRSDVKNSNSKSFEKDRKNTDTQKNSDHKKTNN